MTVNRTGPKSELVAIHEYVYHPPKRSTKNGKTTYSLSYYSDNFSDDDMVNIKLTDYDGVYPVSSNSEYVRATFINVFERKAEDASKFKL